MSLSRPAKFPLLKLPWLCIKCVLLNSDEFILIFFATISNRARRIVKSSSYPIKEIDVGLRRCGRINIDDRLGNEENDKTWVFMHDTNTYYDEFVLHIGSQPLRTCRHLGNDNLHSYTNGDKLDALKMGIEFMIDVFGSTIGQVYVDGDKLSELFGLGLSTVKVLFMNGSDPVNITDLKLLLDTIKATDEYLFFVPISEDFSCDPQIFKCRKLHFGRKKAADWVTLELLYQFDVPQLIFFASSVFCQRRCILYQLLV